LLWIELSADANISNRKKTKLVLLVIAVSYALWLVVSYIITRTVVWWFILDILYALILIFFLQKGSRLISSRLSSATTTFLQRQNPQTMVTVKPMLCLRPHESRILPANQPTHPDSLRLEAKQSNTAQDNPGISPFQIRTFEQIKTVEKSSELMSLFYGLLAVSSSAFVVTLYFPLVGAVTVISAFTMLSSQLTIRFIALEYLAGKKNATTKILNFSRVIVSQFRQH